MKMLMMDAGKLTKNVKKNSPHLGLEPAPSREQTNEWNLDWSSTTEPQRHYTEEKKSCFKICKQKNLRNKFGTCLSVTISNKQIVETKKKTTLVLILHILTQKLH